MSWDVSIDIETLSTRPNALITQIGACLFDRRSGEIHEEVFLSNCHYNDRWPFHKPYDVDHKTVMWWLDQAKEASQSLSNPAPVYIRQALNDLSGWMDAMGFISQSREITMRVWANAPTFDLTILRHAMSVENVVCPWHYRQEHCMRTICTLAKELDDIPIIINEEGLVAHRADHDAIRQARIIGHATRIIHA